jgi:hypothetical protein
MVVAKGTDATIGRQWPLDEWSPIEPREPTYLQEVDRVSFELTQYLQRMGTQPRVTSDEATGIPNGYPIG